MKFKLQWLERRRRRKKLSKLHTPYGINCGTLLWNWISLSTTVWLWQIHSQLANRHIINAAVWPWHTITIKMWLREIVVSLLPDLFVYVCGVVVVVIVVMLLFYSSSYLPAASAWAAMEHCALFLLLFYFYWYTQSVMCRFSVLFNGHEENQCLLCFDEWIQGSFGGSLCYLSQFINHKNHLRWKHKRVHKWNKRRRSKTTEWHFKRAF